MMFSPKPPTRPAPDPFPALAVLLLLAVLILAAAHGSHAPPEGTGAAVVRAVDPNRAPWWELTVLPGIGDGLATRIVEYREQVREESRLGRDAWAFRCPQDLLPVRGIGAATIGRIQGELRFELPSGANQPDGD